LKSQTAAKRSKEVRVMTDLPHTVLIVDDELQSRKLLELLLQPEGYRTVTAATGKEALASIKAKQPDLILLDAMMPGMDGHQVAKILKASAETSNIPIIMVTAETGQDVLLDGLRAGVEEFLTKPVNRAELWLRVRNLLRLKEMNDLVEHQNELLEQEVLNRTATLQRFRTAMDVTGDAILLVDDDTGRFIEVNATASSMFGYSSEEFLGLGTLSLEATTQIELERLRDAIVGGPVSETLSEARIRRKDGWHLPVEIHRQTHTAGGSSTTVSVIRDTTEREEAQLRLYQLAHHDPLTGLPNRTLFSKTLSKSLAHAEREDWQVALLCIDLDHFKKVNDTHGHAMGDVLLGQVGERLVECVRLRDTVGRLGGDEFALIVNLEEGRTGAPAIADKIHDVLRAPFTLGNSEVSVTASIGITSYPDDATDPEVLMKSADIAMYRAKQCGRDTHCTFTRKMNVEMLTQLSLEAAVHKAVENEEFVVHYQPKVDTESGRVIGLEALLRWQRPGYGLVAPHYFIPALEETGLIVEVGNWVIATVCRQIKAWAETSIGPIAVAVNVSSRQFVDHDLDGDVERALLESGIDAGLLELELTESSLMQHTESTVAALASLKNRGVQLSIDDFGTGYSSLAYLQRFPFDKVKIDIAFVRHVTGNTRDATIAQTIIQMAHGLRMTAIAEGVETAEQFGYLRHHGCDQMQGHLFGYPLPLREIEEFLKEDRSLLASI
jgi:diguanylate cyclase (GGDEF)-like protein/PAS domain S-box-containing protein